MSTVPSHLTTHDLEDVYDALALSIDQAGTDHALLFLTKLALLNANSMGDAQRFKENLGIALRDLPG